MNDVIAARPPAWFWVLAVLGLAWEAFGVFTYLMHVGMIGGGDAGAMSEAERALMEGIPTWATAAYAIAVFAGLLGALGLVMRKSWARPLLWLSLIAVVIQFGWWILLSGAMDVIGASMLVMPAIVILAAVVLVWFAGTGVRRGWLT